MLEKKYMYHYNTDSMSNETCKVGVIYDTENDNVMMFTFNEEDGEWFAPGRNDRFFKTEQDAKESYDSYLKSLIDEIPEFSSKIDALFDLYDDGSYEGDFETFKKLKDFYEKYKRDRYERSFTGYRDRCRCLEYYIQTGFINIEADSFRKEDVGYLKWCEKGEVDVVMKSGRVLAIFDDSAKVLLNILFGGHNNEYYYKTPTP